MVKQISLHAAGNAERGAYGSKITRRYIIFVPNTDIKKELEETSVNITCYDRTGKVVKQGTSTDDPDKNPDGTDGNGGGSSTGGTTPNPGESSGNVGL